MEENPYRSSAVSLDRKEKGGSGFMKVLKIVLIGFGIIFAILVAFFVFVGVSTSNTYSKFENISEPFIKEFLASQNPWSYEIAKPKLSTLWLEASTDEDGEKLFKYFNKLGSLLAVKSISMQRCSNFKSTDGTIERCDYLVNADYENGVADIYFGLSMEDETIKLMQLRVNSDVFMQ